MRQSEQKYLPLIFRREKKTTQIQRLQMNHHCVIMGPCEKQLAKSNWTQRRVYKGTVDNGTGRVPGKSGRSRTTREWTLCNLEKAPGGTDPEKSCGLRRGSLGDLPGRERRPAFPHLTIQPRPHLLPRPPDGPAPREGKP